jgi:hypothetical protein
VEEKTLGALLFFTFAIIEADNESSTLFQWNDRFGAFVTAEDISFGGWNNNGQNWLVGELLLLLVS